MPLPYSLHLLLCGMPLLPVNDESIKQAAALISQGGLVAFPTETVYGLGANAYNPAALAKIFEVKNRPRFDPLIVHIAAMETLEKISDRSLLDAAARNNLTVLTNKLWPGPLTLILPKQAIVPDLCTSGLPTVAVRMPDHDAALQLIRQSTGAIAAPSANPFGYLSPTRAEHVAQMLGDKVEIILDGGPAQCGLESTVLDLCHDQPRILRPGAVPKETIESLIGSVAAGHAADDDVPNSPGLLKNHYAPHVALDINFLSEYFSQKREAKKKGAKEDAENNSCSSSSAARTEGSMRLCVNSFANSAFLFFDGASRDQWLSSHTTQPAHIAVLSETGNLTEAASRLFEILHELDTHDVPQIYAQPAPEHGLGIAINDRLHRAAASKR